MTETQAKPPRSLGAMASRGAAVTLGGQGLRMILQLGGIILLARLLDPSDYGLLAMVTAVIGIGELVRDFGLSSAAIQAKTLTKGQKSNLFWVNSGIGLVLAIAATAAAGLIAQLYGDDRVQIVTMVLSLTFLLNGISTQFRADLARNFLFGKLAASEIAGQAFGIAAGIVFALLGFGYWALVIQQLTQVFITQIFLLIVTPWSPGWIDRKATIRPFLNYGVNVLGTQLIGYVARNVDSVVIGTRFGAYDLGLYNRAFQLMMMPLLQIQAPSTRVALPVLSRLQDQRERFASFINVGQTALIGVVGFAFAALGAQAPAAVSLFLGPQWLALAGRGRPPDPCPRHRIVGAGLDRERLRDRTRQHLRDRRRLADRVLEPAGLARSRRRRRVAPGLCAAAPRRRHLLQRVPLARAGDLVAGAIGVGAAVFAARAVRQPGDRARGHTRVRRSHLSPRRGTRDALRPHPPPAVGPRGAAPAGLIPERAPGATAIVDPRSASPRSDA